VLQVICDEEKIKDCSVLKMKLFRNLLRNKTKLNSTPWSESASELYRPSDRRLSAKWLPNFADRVCHVVSVTDSYGLILVFLYRSRYFFLSSSSSVVLTRLSGLRSRPTTYFFLVVPGIEPGPPDLQPRTLTIRPQMRFYWSIAIYIFLETEL
jgi:hypothetical protein